MEELPMGDESDLAKQWGWIALRGVAAVVFGALAYIAPGATLATLVIFWGAYALVDGVLALVVGFTMRDNGKPLWAMIAIGLIGVGAGLATFMWPALTAITLIFIIGYWAILIGIFQIVAAIRLRRTIDNEWLLGLSGLLSIVFGLLLVLRPGEGALTLVWLIGGYAIIFGVLLVVLALRLRARLNG
jgi:uncharacterized membrane protein HdeD (DUF308 family)